MSAPTAAREIAYNGFDRLAIETNQYIASFLATDKELAAFRVVCRSTHDAIDADNNSYWRRRFLSRFEMPAWSSQGNMMFKDQYQTRRRLLRRAATFRLGRTDTEKLCLLMLRDLLLGRDSKATGWTDGQADVLVDAFSENAAMDTRDDPSYISVNLVEVRRFVNDHGLLRIVFRQDSKHRKSRQRATCYQPAPLLALVQVLLAPDMLSLGTRMNNNHYSFPESQQWVYGTPLSDPLFGGCDGLNVDMEGVLHLLNFWKYHMLRPEEGTLHNAFSALPENELPRFWSGQLKQGRKELGRRWKGSYAYLDRADVADVRAGEGYHEIIQDMINREGEQDAFQNMRLRFVPVGDERWTATFEKHLKSITPPSSNAKTRAQHRTSESNIAACDKPQNFHFDGEGIDESDSFSAMGWLSPLPPQMDVPGWQRMTMMKYFTDQFGNIDMYALWAYEGVVLPGGQIMLGRWWAAEEDTPAEDVYSGPFILWNVDGPEDSDEDDLNADQHAA